VRAAAFDAKSFVPHADLHDLFVRNVLSRVPTVCFVDRNAVFSDRSSLIDAGRHCFLIDRLLSRLSEHFSTSISCDGGPGECFFVVDPVSSAFARFLVS
jgi:hypothetical protein